MNSLAATASIRSELWRNSLRQISVWRRAAKITLWVGAIQVGLNQGDYWLSGQVTRMVVVKTILTPVVTFAVAFYAAAETYVEQQLDAMRIKS